MPQGISTSSITLQETPNTGNELLDKLLRERRSGRLFQERRHADWDEIYTLYRNKVFTNRLTQRQAVNIPIMKETVKTLLAKIDEPPNVDWKELKGDQYKQLLFQEIWNLNFDVQNFEAVDIQDKKNVLLYGRGFKKLNITDSSMIAITALDIYDVVVDPLTDPLDLETARFLVHQNIFRSLREILADERYNDEAKQKLKVWAMTPEGLVQSNRNKEEHEKKMERMRAMGINSHAFPLFAAGDVLVHLNEHYTNVWNTPKKAFERRVIVTADDQFLLLDEPLKELIGVDFWPFVSWAEDIETSDFWSDGPADLVRVPNKVINIWFSQLVENRTLRNFQMHWFDATNEGYTPQTYDPGPGKMLPAPGNPRETIMPVEVSGLDETLNSIDFIIKLIERGTSATAIEKGVSERKQITLGEVETLVGKALERTQLVVKFYRRSWQELAQKWAALLDANASGSIELHKVAKSGKIWPKIIWPKDWKSEAGYRAFVRSSSEQEDEKTRGVQRFMFLLQQFPDNAALRKIAQRRMIELADLTPEEIREVTEEEEQMRSLMAAPQTPQAQQMQQQVQLPPTPQRVATA